MDLNAIFHTYGPHVFPWVVLVCAMLENDVTFIMAGIYASSVHPHLNPTAAVLAGVVGALCHDSFWFAVGRHRADWLQGTTAWKKVGPAVQHWAQRIGSRELFFCRLVPGTRNASFIFWGTQRLPWRVFLGWQVFSLALWGSLLTAMGFWFSRQAQAVLGRVHHHHLGRWMLGALVVTAVGYYSVRAWNRRRIAQREARAAAGAVQD